jgi:SAM-dependent methyltransferase
MVPGADWEREAENWVRWARTPGFDSYWFYSAGFFEDIVPPPGALTLDLGCGEGRGSRDLVARGHRVVGIDASATLVRYARDADRRGRYLLGDGAALPFPDGSFDLVVAYNALMDVDDMPGTVREAARVLGRGGRFCFSVTHPINDAGAFTGEREDAPYAIPGSYFGRRRFEETFERGGLQMTFRGWCYALEDYSRAVEDAGLLLERIREPRATDEAVAARSSFRRWQRIPVFLQARAVKPE